MATLKLAHVTGVRRWVGRVEFGGFSGLDGVVEVGILYNGKPKKGMLKLAHIAGVRCLIGIFGFGALYDKFVEA